MSKSWITIHTDGCSYGNPGRSGWGAVLRFNQHKKFLSGYLGHATANQAELIAVTLSLRAIKYANRYVSIYSDSKYVVEGIRGNWKIKTNHKEWKILREELKRHKEVVFNWIPREMNQDADRLSKLGANQDGTNKV